MRREPPNKIQWTKSQEDFIRRNHGRLTNVEMAKRLDVRLTSLRTKCYSMGLKQMELQYWTQDQIDFLLAYYPLMGDRS